MAALRLGTMQSNAQLHGVPHLLSSVVACPCKRIYNAFKLHLTMHYQLVGYSHSWRVPHVIWKCHCCQPCALGYIKTTVLCESSIPQHSSEVVNRYHHSAPSNPSSLTFQPFPHPITPHTTRSTHNVPPTQRLHSHKRPQHLLHHDPPQRNI